MRSPLSAAHLVLALACAGGLGSSWVAAAEAVDRGAVEAAVTAWDLKAIERTGADALPVLVEMYREADVAERAWIAGIFYQLGWKSEAAKRAMMEDIHTSDRNLRIQVQWALGRVSNDDDVVDALLDNMRDGFSPLVRDKAGCALADDQIHLTERQKVALYRRLIDLLEDSSAEQRSLAIRVLQVHTGQTKGFHPVVRNAEAVARWRRGSTNTRRLSSRDGRPSASAGAHAFSRRSWSASALRRLRTGNPARTDEPAFAPLASLTFDRGTDSGPDTFRVWEERSGSVTKTREFRWSGDYSLELRDVAGNGEFPELLGFFPLRRSGPGLRALRDPRDRSRGTSSTSR